MTSASRATAPRPPPAPPHRHLLGERHARLARRIGGNRAKCAVARSILIIVWHLLSEPGARFADLGPGWHDRKAGRDRKIRAHLRQLQALGLHVELTEATA